MSSKTTRRTDQNIVHSVRSGPIVADVLRGITSDGHAYLYFQLSRAWQPHSGVRENYSQRLYERNGRDITRAVQEVSAWIQKNPQAADRQPTDQPVASSTTQKAA